MSLHLGHASVLCLAVCGIAVAQAPSAAHDDLAAIAAIDRAGPRINAVIVVKDAATLSREIAAARSLPLHGRTVLVKDNIETREWPTTAGSLALKNNASGRDAPLIARLRTAGGVVLGKTNLSEWANIRSSRSTSGWSAVGGLTRNPYSLSRNACGSSSGSGAAVAAGLSWAAIGTETDGSITCPASVNGVVGFKPTVGMVSRTYVVPISHSQDTAGPLARSVEDAALLLNAIAGSDPLDPATAAADRHKSDFTAGLASASLKGVRIGVLRKQIGTSPEVTKLFEHARADLVRAGAVLVDIDYDPPAKIGDNELAVLLFELRTDLGKYLGGSPAPIAVRTLKQVIAFNDAHPAEEMRWFGQDLFLKAEKATDRKAYAKARAASLNAAGAQGIDRLLKARKVEFLIAPTAGPAWTTDFINGDHIEGSIGAGNLPAIAGYPHLSVPMGYVAELPVGLSIIGPKWSDARVLRAGAAFERARTVRLMPPGYRASDKS